MENIERKKNLSSDQLLQLQSAYDARKKSKGVAYVLWFFLGRIGAHRYYMNRPGTATTLLLLSIASLGLSVASGLMGMDTSLFGLNLNPSTAASSPSASTDDVLHLFLTGGSVAVSVVLGIWWLVDAFLLSRIVDQHNQEIENEILTSLGV